MKDLKMLFCIERLLMDFFNYEWKSKDFLTEDDVRCRLYNNLQNKLNDKTISIHSEIRWYGEADKGGRQLKYRSDIVFIDNYNLSDDKITSSKGYWFENYYLVIEIKLRRINNKDSNKKYEEIINKDIEKLKEIANRTKNNKRSKKKYYVIIFDKKERKKAIIVNDRLNKWNYKIEWKEWKISS